MTNLVKISRKSLKWSPAKVPGDQFGDSRPVGVGFRAQKSIKVSFFILKSDVSYDFWRRQPSAPYVQLPLYGLGHVSAAA
ncbi:MAG: hypothetical protein IIZ66_05805, partial [Clostridia bacterium]|nr:hypothetical protein [Clostridia bacterium]